MTAPVSRRAVAALLMGGALGLGVSPLPAVAQGWKPGKTVEIVVGAGPGGGNDRIARVLQKVLTEEKILDVTVIVVNKPGAGGEVAMKYLNAQRDPGHFVLVTNPSLITNPLTGIGTLKYTDVTPIAQLSSEYPMLFVRTDSPVKTAQDMIERLRANPASLSVAVAPGLGTGPHIAAASVAKAAGIEPKRLKVIPFKSGSEGLSALLGGQVDMMSSTPANVLPQFAAGKVRVLGITAAARIGGVFADVPTFREQGYDAVLNNWRGVVGPKGMTAAEAAYWAGVFATVSKSAIWRQEIEQAFAVVEVMGPQESAAFLARDHEETRAVLGALGLLQ